jgi:hypothetical protein
VIETLNTIYFSGKKKETATPHNQIQRWNALIAISWLRQEDSPAKKSEVIQGPFSGFVDPIELCPKEKLFRRPKPVPGLHNISIMIGE